MTNPVNILLFNMFSVCLWHNCDYFKLFRWLVWSFWLDVEVRVQPHPKLGHWAFRHRSLRCRPCLKKSFLLSQTTYILIIYVMIGAALAAGKRFVPFECWAQKSSGSSRSIWPLAAYRPRMTNRSSKRFTCRWYSSLKCWFSKPTSALAADTHEKSCNLPIFDEAKVGDAMPSSRFKPVAAHYFLARMWKTVVRDVGCQTG